MLWLFFARLSWGHVVPKCTVFSLTEKWIGLTSVDDILRHSRHAVKELSYASHRDPPYMSHVLVHNYNCNRSSYCKVCSLYDFFFWHTVLFSLALNRAVLL